VGLAVEAIDLVGRGAVRTHRTVRPPDGFKPFAGLGFVSKDCVRELHGVPPGGAVSKSWGYLCHLHNRLIIGDYTFDTATPKV
jgi:hypothetical protein